MAPTKDGSNKRRKANEDSDDDDKEVGAKAEELARIIGKNFFQVEAADEGMGRRLLSVRPFTGFIGTMRIGCARVCEYIPTLLTK